MPKLVIHAESHIHEGVGSSALAYVIGRLEDMPGTGGVQIHTFTLPSALVGKVRCGLYGPCMGDPPIPEGLVYHARREPRTYPSRICRGVSGRDTDVISLICGPHDDQPCVLYTIFGGPVAPKEPNDPTIQAHEVEASKQFWRVHALAEHY